MSCANEGRKFGSLEINRQEEQSNKLEFNEGMIAEWSCLDFLNLRLPTFPNNPCNQRIHFFGDVKATILETYCTHHLHWVHPTPRFCQSN